MFPFSEWIDISVDHRTNLKVHYSEIMEHIFPLLTNERREKIFKTTQNRTFKHAMVLEDIFDRGNMSAVMRSSEAFGLGAMHIIETGNKQKESQRTTAGADKWLEVSRWKSTEECVSNLKKQGKKILATHLSSEAKSIHSIDFSSDDYAVVLGNEHRGISEEMKNLADECIILPMYGFVQSFNISVAGALICQIIRGQIEKNDNWKLNQEEQKILAAVYAMRTQDSAKDILCELANRGQSKTILRSV